MINLLIVPLGASHGENSNLLFKGPLHAKAVSIVLDLDLDEDTLQKITNAFVEMSGKPYKEHIKEALKIIKKDELYTEGLVNEINTKLNELASESCPTVTRPEIVQKFDLKINPDFVEFMEKAKQKNLTVMFVSNGMGDSATPKAEGTENIVLSQGQAKKLVENGEAIVLVNHKNSFNNLKENGIEAIFIDGEKLSTYFN